MQVNPL